MPYTLAREPIKVQSGRYDESLKVERTQQDLVNEMAQELIDLRPHTAYVKSAWKGKIQTLGVAQAPGSQLVDVTVSAWYNAIVTGILKPRTDIEEEIRERQENWGRRRGNEPPPPKRIPEGIRRLPLEARGAIASRHQRTTLLRNRQATVMLRTREQAHIHGTQQKESRCPHCSDLRQQTPRAGRHRRWSLSL